jgi:hypothetical protein
MDAATVVFNSNLSHATLFEVLGILLLMVLVHK